MNETIFVVFIIMIIIVLSMVGYSKFQELGLKEQQKNIRNAKIIETAHRLSFWSELSCSEAGGISEVTCLDVTKIKVLGDFISRSSQDNKYAFNYYFDLLRNSKITITQVYPFTEPVLGETQWMVWNNTGVTRTTDIIRVPTNLYNPLTKNYAFGIMELQVYE
jgi:hypothetical protein